MAVTMASRRFVMVAGRTTKQGQQVNIGKEHPDYWEIVGTLILNPEDLASLGIAPGSRVRVRSEYGEAVFRCRDGDVPSGIVFVPYGPPTSRLMGGDTEGTGMPAQKGWEVEIEAVEDGGAQGESQASGQAGAGAF
jgi:formylmethanofuran dehydrogenase subunit D